MCRYVVKKLCMCIHQIGSCNTLLEILALGWDQPNCGARYTHANSIHSTMPSWTCTLVTPLKPFKSKSCVGRTPFTESSMFEVIETTDAPESMTIALLSGLHQWPSKSTRYWNWTHWFRGTFLVSRDIWEWAGSYGSKNAGPSSCRDRCQAQERRLRHIIADYFPS